MCESDRVLAVFARYPERGRVKTRLARFVGEERALELYEAMLFDTLQRLGALECRKRLFLTGCSLEQAARLVDREAGLSGRYELALQEGQSLGERMWHAVRSLLRGARKVVIVGSDAPTLPLSFVERAFEALDQVPVVLGPVPDGGYYLIGARDARRELFEGIPWGTDSVLERTLESLQAPCRLLPRWYDVDTGEDLQRLCEELETAPEELGCGRLRRHLGLRKGK